MLQLKAYGRKAHVLDCQSVLYLPATNKATIIFVCVCVGCCVCGCVCVSIACFKSWGIFFYILKLLACYSFMTKIEHVIFYDDFLGFIKSNHSWLIYHRHYNDILMKYCDYLRLRYNFDRVRSLRNSLWQKGRNCRKNMRCQFLNAALTHLLGYSFVYFGRLI